VCNCDSIFIFALGFTVGTDTNQGALRSDDGRLCRLLTDARYGADVGGLCATGEDVPGGLFKEKVTGQSLVPGLVFWHAPTFCISFFSCKFFVFCADCSIGHIPGDARHR